MSNYFSQRTRLQSYWYVHAKELERENEQLRQALVKARPYVEESGPPGTGIVTTEESAERSAALLVEIDEALNHGETNETLHRTT